MTPSWFVAVDAGESPAKRPKWANTNLIWANSTRLAIVCADDTRASASARHQQNTSAKGQFPEFYIAQIRLGRVVFALK